MSDGEADATADDGAADEGSKRNERHATQSGGSRHAGRAPKQLKRMISVYN